MASKNLKTLYEIEATGTGELKSAFTQVNETLAKSAKKAEEVNFSFAGIGGSLATVALKFNSVTAGVSTAIAGVKSLFDTIHEGAKLADASKNFEKTGLSLERLASASGNTQTNAEIERAISLTKDAAAANGLYGKSYEDLMYSTLQLADAYDQALEPTIREILKATNGETKTLKEKYGIVVDIAGSLEDYAEKLGVSVDALTEQEKQAARNASVQNALNEAASNFPSKTTVTWLDRITTALANAADASKKFLANWIAGEELPDGVTEIANEAEIAEKNYLKALETFENQALLVSKNLSITLEEASKSLKESNSLLYKNLIETEKEYYNARLRAQEEADFNALIAAEKAAKQREIEEKNHKRAQLELDAEWEKKRLDLLKSSHQKQLEEIYSQWEKEAQAALEANLNIDAINKYYEKIRDDEIEKQAKEKREKDKARFDIAKKELETQQRALQAIQLRISEETWATQEHTQAEIEEKAYRRRVEAAQEQIKNEKLLKAALIALEDEHVEKMAKSREEDEKRQIERIKAVNDAIAAALEKTRAPATSEEARAKEAIELQRKQYEEQIDLIRRAKEENSKLINEGNKEAIEQAEILNLRELDLIDRRKNAELEAQKTIAEARERDLKNSQAQQAKRLHDQIALNDAQKSGIEGIITGTTELSATLTEYGKGAGIIQTAEMLASGIKAGCDAIDYAAESTAAFATGNIVAGIGLAAASVAKFASAAQYAKGLAELGAQGFTIPSQNNTQNNATQAATTGSQALTGQNQSEKQEISVNLTFKGEQANVGRYLIGEMNKEAYIKGGARLNSRVVR